MTMVSSYLETKQLILNIVTSIVIFIVLYYYIFIKWVLYLNADDHEPIKNSGTTPNSTVIAVTISVAMLALLAAVLVIVIIVVVIVKKKFYNKKEENNAEHYYESIPPPSTATPRKPAPGNLDKVEATVVRDSEYEDLKCKDSGHNAEEYVELSCNRMKFTQCHQFLLHKKMRLHSTNSILTKAQCHNNFENFT